MIKDDVTEHLRNELVSILKQPKYFEACMVRRMPLTPLKQNHKTQVVFLIIVGIILAIQFLIVLPNQKYTIPAYIIVGLTPVVLISWSIASIKDAGHLKQDHKFMDLLATIHPCEMCPDCEVLRTPRSRHCAICDSCVERFDHHCPWVNNCVGNGNHNAFLVFVSSISFLIVSIMGSCILQLFYPCDHLQFDCPLNEFCWQGLCHSEGVQITVITIQLIFLFLLGLPFTTTLCIFHSRNYCMGRTTNERLAKKRVRS